MFNQQENLVFWGLLGIIGLILIGAGYILYRRWQRGYGSLTTQLLLAFAGVSGVSLLLVIGAIIWQTRIILTAQTGQSFQTLAEANSLRLIEELDEQVNLMENLAETDSLFYTIFGSGNTDLGTLSSEERNVLVATRDEQWQNNTNKALRSQVLNSPVSIDLNRFVQNSPGHTQVIYVDQFGALQAVGGQLPDNYYFGDQEWWRVAWFFGQGDIYIGNLQYTPGQADATIDIAVPVKTSLDAKANGILHTRFTIKDLTVLNELSQLVGDENFSLVNTKGDIIYSTNLSKVGSKLPEAFKVDVVNYPSNWGVGIDQTGETVIHSHAVLRPGGNKAYLSDLNWAFIVEQPSAQALGAVQQLTKIALTGGVLALVLSIVVGILIARQISRPIQNLTATASEMSQGQLDKQAQIAGPAEIRTLAVSFNSMTAQLNQTLHTMEERIAQRTQRLETLAVISEELSAILDFEQLMSQMVNEVKERFGYYHAHVYILDKAEKNLVVAAGTGTAGIEMMARGHSIPLNARTSLVARAARTGVIVSASNVREDSNWLPNPLLPDTYSEMAVPIILDNKVVGVLDVQENRIAGLDESDANTLRFLANQVAVTIRNVRLFDQTQTALVEAQIAQEQYIEQSWEKTVAMQQAGHAVYNQPGFPEISEATYMLAEQKAKRARKPAMVKLDDNEVSPRPIVAPIQFRDKTIGAFQAHKMDSESIYYWSDEDMSFVAAVLDQVAQAADSLRLYNESRERASREQMLREVTDKLRSAPNLDALLETAARELGNRLGVKHTVLELGVESKQRQQASRPKSNGL